ncbi:MAG: DUF3641 domain-containing protein, partial [Planctomycetota bacterium]
RELMSRYGIEFNQLLTITNIPIRRYASYLRKRGRLDEYMDLLRQSFNAATIDHLMCKHLVSISWDGKIFDCDFNQMINLVDDPKTIWDINSFDEFCYRRIASGDHCFGCTAGAGSSCGGALVADGS